MELSFLYLHFPTASLSSNMKTMMVFHSFSVWRLRGSQDRGLWGWALKDHSQSMRKTEERKLILISWYKHKSWVQEMTVQSTYLSPPYHSHIYKQWSPISKWIGFVCSHHSYARLQKFKNKNAKGNTCWCLMFKPSSERTEVMPGDIAQALPHLHSRHQWNQTPGQAKHLVIMVIMGSLE